MTVYFIPSKKGDKTNEIPYPTELKDKSHKEGFGDRRLQYKPEIDCFVSLNEGLYEGGGSYANNSDLFLGCAMPLFKGTVYLYYEQKLLPL